jgi:hypothetical protein
LFEFLVFLLPVLLLWVGISKPCWIRVVRVDTLVSLLTYKEIVSIFPHLQSTQNNKSILVIISTRLSVPNWFCC